MHPLIHMDGGLRIYQSGTEGVDLPLGDKQAVAQV
jgi:hypothetical protein